MPLVPAAQLTAIASSLLRAIGTPETAADRVAQHLVDANLSGHDSHGILRIEQYFEHALDGLVQPAAAPEVLKEGPTTALVDGHFTWGPVVGDFATEVALAKAKEHGIGMVSVRRCYHLGRVGVYPEKAALDGFLGVAFCNVHGSARVAPWGGTERRLPTNPIAFAVPTRDQPIVVDFATSAVAEGKVRLANKKGEPVPEGWVYDAEGRWTNDPATLYTDGSLAPLGGDQGHKGYALSVAMDLFGGLLSGAGSALLTKTYGNGLLLQVIDPTLFTERGEYYDKIDDYAAYLKSASRRPGVDQVLLPGDIERRRTQERTQSGLDVPNEVWKMLVRLGDEFNVNVTR